MFPSPKEVDQSFATGNPLAEKPLSDFRFVFTTTTVCRSLSPILLADFFLQTKQLQADWVGIAESHIDSQKLHVKAKIQQAMKFLWSTNAIHSAFSSSDLE